MADVDLTVTIPDAWQAKVLDAFTQSAGAYLRLEIDKHDPNPENELRAEWQLTIAPKGETETLKQFGQRFLRELGKAVVNAIDKKEDEDRYRSEVSAITPPVSDVPTDILT
jgi:hypothetical protein